MEVREIKHLFQGGTFSVCENKRCPYMCFHKGQHETDRECVLACEKYRNRFPNKISYACRTLLIEVKK